MDPTNTRPWPRQIIMAPAPRPNRRSARACAQALLMCLLPLTTAAAQDAGDPDAGHELAQRWCANCHVVSPRQTQGSSTGAPPFTAIAAQKGMTPMALRAFLQTSHPRMPNWQLSRTETDDVIAYILSLRQRPAR